jgi:hypothetical protein
VADRDLLRPWLPVDLLDNAARTISENKAVMLGLPAVGSLVVVAVQALIAQVSVPGGLPGLFAEDPGDDQMSGARVAGLVVMYGSELVLYTVAGTVLSGIIAIAAVRSQLNARVGARELLRLVRPSLPALLGVGAVQSLILIGLFAVWFGLTFGAAFGVSLTSSAAAGLVAVLIGLAGVPVLVVFGVRLAMAGTVILLEGRKAPDLGLYVPRRVGVGGALKRSWRLVHGKFWRTLGILLFAGVVVWIVGYAVETGVFALIASLGAWIGFSGGAGRVAAISVGIAGAAGILMTTIASLSFVTAVQAMLYLDLRVRREGLDLWLRPALRPRAQVVVPPAVGDGR